MARIRVLKFLLLVLAGTINWQIVANGVIQTGTF